MACFLVPATEAIVTTIVAKAVKSHEAKAEEQTKDNKALRLSVGRLRTFGI